MRLGDPDYEIDREILDWEQIDRKIRDWENLMNMKSIAILAIGILAELQVEV